MARKGKRETSGSFEPEVKRERIGILYKNFVQSQSLGPHVHTKSYKVWNAGQLVMNEDDIEMLLKLNAPMGVYIKYVDRSTES